MTFDKDRAAAVREAINDTIGTIKGDYTISAPAEVKAELMPHLKDMLVLERNLLATVEVVRGRPETYEHLWRSAMDNLDAAMEIVQENSDYFGARVGDDKIKVIGEFFVKWWQEKQVRP